MVDKIPPGGRTYIGPPRYKSTNKTREYMFGDRKNFEEIIEELSEDSDYDEPVLKAAHSSFKGREHLPETEEVREVLDSYSERLLV